MNGDVNGFGLLASLILIGVAVGISRWQRLGLEGSILVAVARATGQLLLVGLGLGLVLADDAPLLWSWLWVAGIIVFAAVTVQRRAPAIPGLFLGRRRGPGRPPSSASASSSACPSSRWRPGPSSPCRG